VDERCGVSAGFPEGWVKVDDWRGGRVSERWGAVRMFVVWGLAGELVGVGLALPQWVAYGRYCLTDTGAEEVGSWCDDTVPRIYLFFRSGIGLFSGLPLPLSGPRLTKSGTWASYDTGRSLASRYLTPALTVLIRSGI